MAKNKEVWACQKCGYQSPKWLGKCPDCSAWNTLVEETALPAEGAARASLEHNAQPLPLKEIRVNTESRYDCGMEEFNRVLGGGLVLGSLVLIGGDPGIGKSTILLQTADALARKAGSVLYVSGEESASQTKLRGERLGATADALYILPETSLEKIHLHVKKLNPAVLIIDSIQTVYTNRVESAPGSVSQVKECAGQLMLLAKGLNIPTFVVGHVTKDGAIAGPRVLEHIVDTVLYFEGDPGHPFRILRAVKNRFGATNEIGVFEMKGAGLAEVANPSALFLAERPIGVPGSVVTATVEGTRPVLVEVQALVATSPLGTPRRTTLGVDSNRLALLLAVMEKRLELQLSGQDTFVNAAGGMKLTEPAVDLAMAVAVASSFLGKAVEPDLVFIGEIGLAGEVRAVTNPEARLKEAHKMGFKRAMLPEGSLKTLGSVGLTPVPVKNLEEAFDILFAGGAPAPARP